MEVLRARSPLQDPQANSNGAVTNEVLRTGSPSQDPQVDSDGEGLTNDDIAELDNITEASQKFLTVSTVCTNKLL